MTLSLHCVKVSQIHRQCIDMTEILLTGSLNCNSPTVMSCRAPVKSGVLLSVFTRKPQGQIWDFIERGFILQSWY